MPRKHAVVHIPPPSRISYLGTSCIFGTLVGSTDQVAVLGPRAIKAVIDLSGERPSGYLVLEFLLQRRGNRGDWIVNDPRQVCQRLSPPDEDAILVRYTSYLVGVRANKGDYNQVMVHVSGRHKVIVGRPGISGEDPPRVIET